MVDIYLIYGLNQIFYRLPSDRSGNDGEKPVDDSQYGDACEKEIPEPEKSVDPLIGHVDGKDANAVDCLRAG